MIQPTEPTYGVFLTLIRRDTDVLASASHLPVIAYAREGVTLVPQFLPPGRVQTYNVFDVRAEFDAEFDTPDVFFLGLLIPNALVPEVSEQQWKKIIANATDHLRKARDHFGGLRLSEELEAWLGETNGES